MKIVYCLLLALALAALSGPSQAAGGQATAVVARVSKHHKRFAKARTTKAKDVRQGGTAHTVSGNAGRTQPTPQPFPPAWRGAAPARPLRKVYWGARIDGEVYHRADAPWDATTWDRFEQHAPKKVSLLHFGQPAPWEAAFTPAPFDMVTARGAIPYMSMSSENVLLTSIADGSYDSSLLAWAQAAKRYGKPFFLRWNWEMNGTWFNWGAQAKANPATYVSAWKHFHDVVQEGGATNVTWVWCPNTVFSNSTPLTSLYPGDAYVDWTCADGYNFGTIPFKPDVWKGFYADMKPTYDQLLTLAPGKPILIGEAASTEYGGSKSAWITDMLTTQLPMNFPKIRALAWFNWNIHESGGRRDWQIESSASAKAAFAHAIALPNYATNTYGNLPPLSKVPLPQ